MTEKHQSQIKRDEHAVIGGVSGKKVFVIDNAGNQITSFSSPTVAIASSTILNSLTTITSMVTVASTPYSFYQQASLISGYTYYGLAAVGSNPTTANFKLLRETLNSGEILYGGGAATFVHAWSAASLASVSYS